MNSFLCLVILGIAVSNVTALTNDELDKIHESMVVFIKECSKEFGVSDDELKAAKESGNVDGVEPCLIGCVFKKANFIDGDGKFLPDKVKENAKKYLSQEEDQTLFGSVVDTCAAANDEEVTDGDAGCVRSKLVFECFIKHKGDVSTYLYFKQKIKQKCS
uniref:Odorant-binding protein 11 n=1 Tax=Galleria mellonella TaxID=7137 RepID=A0A5C0E4K3_GALME|nr:odorant-binding protein 11 [Galleria mellonella]